MNSIYLLCNDLKRKIALYLSPKDILNLCCFNKNLYINVFQNDNLWRSKLEKDYNELIVNYLPLAKSAGYSWPEINLQNFVDFSKLDYHNFKCLISSHVNFKTIILKPIINKIIYKDLYIEHFYRVENYLKYRIYSVDAAIVSRYKKYIIEKTHNKSDLQPFKLLYGFYLEFKLRFLKPDLKCESPEPNHITLQIDPDPPFSEEICLKYFKTNSEELRYYIPFIQILGDLRRKEIRYVCSILHLLKDLK